MSESRRIPPAVDTRDAIIQAATRLFAEHGFHGTKTRDIAECAQVSLGLLHHHFGAKEALWNAVGERISADFMDYVANVLDSDSSSPDAILDALRTYLAYWKRNAAAFRFNLWRLIEGPGDERKARSALVAKKAVPLFRRAQRDGYLRDDIAPGIALSVATALVQYWLHSQIELRGALSVTGNSIPTDDEFLKIVLKLLAPLRRR